VLPAATASSTPGVATHGNTAIYFSSQALAGI